MLARMLTKDYVIEQLSAWEDCIDPSSFDLNDFALSGPLYDRFLDRLYEHRREVKGGC